MCPEAVYADSMSWDSVVTPSMSSTMISTNLVKLIKVSCAHGQQNKYKRLHLLVQLPGRILHSEASEQIC